jgi:hypothetical protein
MRREVEPELVDDCKVITIPLALVFLMWGKMSTYEQEPLAVQCETRPDGSLIPHNLQGASSADTCSNVVHGIDVLPSNIHTQQQPYELHTAYTLVVVPLVESIHSKIESGFPRHTFTCTLEHN